MKHKQALRNIFAIAATSVSLTGLGAAAQAAPLKSDGGRIVAIGDSIARGTQAAGNLAGGECPYDTPPGYYYNNSAVNMHGGTCISRPADAIRDILRKPAVYLPGVKLKGADVILSTGLSNETGACRDGVSPVVRQQLEALRKAGVKRVAVLGTSANGTTYYGTPLNPMNTCLRKEISKYSKKHPHFARFVGPVTHTESTPQHIHPANYYEVLRQARKTLSAIPQKNHKR
jgi:hypothetical protein